MQARTSGYMTQAEWRWLSLICTTLLVFATLPVLIAGINSATLGARFMGAVHDIPGVAADLSRMQQGYHGEWLVTFKHTPQAHDNLFLLPIYTLLGHVANFTGIRLALVYHVARLIAAFVMYVAIYDLGASIWVRVRARRTFFLICAIGGGVGWLVAMFVGEATTPDLLSPLAFPFYATLINVEFPLTIACLATLAKVMVMVLRPGFAQAPSVANGGVTLSFVVLGMAILHPQGIFPVFTAFIVCIAWKWLVARRVDPLEARWVLWAVVPALPLGAYYTAIILNQPVVGSWLMQQAARTYSPIELLTGFGLPLLLALPALWQSLRHRHPDGDRFMLIWLMAILVAITLPLSVHDLFIAGAILPIAYFATRAAELVWFPTISRRYWRWMVVSIIPLLGMSALFVAYVPLLPYAQGRMIAKITLSPDYVNALAWIETRTRTDAVILAAPDVSVWIPALTNRRVVYGHPSETADAAKQLTQVMTWYTSDDAVECATLDAVQSSVLGSYQVSYMLVGDAERALGGATCTEALTRVNTIGSVDIYACDANCPPLLRDATP